MNIKIFFFQKTRFCILSFSTLFCLSLIANFSAADKLLTHNAYLKQQREHYILAKKAFQLDDKLSYEKLKTKLQDYLLYPYLEYSEIINQLNQLPYLQVDRFLKQHHGSYLADQLSTRWLKQLAKQKHWRSYKRYYKPQLNSAALYCHYLWSQFKAGDKNIYSQVATLWNVGKSQPDECNKVFDEWRKTGYLTAEIAWERHQKAIKKGNHQLARYVSRSMPESMQPMAKLYRRIDRNPKIIADRLPLSDDTSINRDIVAHGLRKYAHSNAKAALSLWQQYRHHYTFDAKGQDQLNLHITIQIARKGHFDHAAQLAANSSNSSHASDITLVTTVLHELLKQQQWADILVWIEQLPEIERQSDRWQYWKARALTHTEDQKTQQAARRIYQQLSKNRSYYGFLAADQIGSSYSFAHKPVAVQSQLMQNVEAIPALQRALELFALDKMYGARHEWAYGVRNFSDEQHIAAAQLAAESGWNRKAIESMAAARHWDDLDIRFPLPYTQWVDKASKQVQSDDTLIYAIARQESAWATDALSPAGAVGLMQIMPTTARQTAEKIGLSYSRRRLFQPEYNIIIGSRYIDSLIHRYNGNRLLAIAAYNAGPSRVNRWLAHSDQRLPYDVWVETIPFKETRKYVQNVLYYRVIYGYKTGRSVTLITQNEARQTL